MSDTATVTITAAAPTPAIAIVKTPSKMSQATIIFADALVMRADGKFAGRTPNRDFRHHCLVTMEAKLNVSRSAASTMYQTAYANAQRQDPTLILGRDAPAAKAPKDPANAGKRGRPAGSTNKKVEAAPAETTTVVVADAPAVAAEPVTA